MRLIVGLFLLGLMGNALAFPWLVDGENIRGAKFMTPEERKAHVARMFTFKTYEECRAYMDDHNHMVDERAAKQGAMLPPMQGDPCTVMRAMGRVK